MYFFDFKKHRDMIGKKVGLILNPNIIKELYYNYLFENYTKYSLFQLFAFLDNNVILNILNKKEIVEYMIENNILIKEDNNLTYKIHIKKFIKKIQQNYKEYIWESFCVIYNNNNVIYCLCQDDSIIIDEEHFIILYFYNNNKIMIVLQNSKNRNNILEYEINEFIHIFDDYKNSYKPNFL